MQLRIFVFLLLLFPVLRTSAAGDSVRIATYNLLRYGKPYANRHSQKNLHLQPILAYIRPDIALFNEVSTEVPALLDTLLGVMPFAAAHGGYHNSTGTEILDGLFWRSGRFVLEKDSIICNDVRDIVAYDLYYQEPLLGIRHDTVRLKVITAHFKSSNGVPDRALRAAEAQKVSDYLSSLQQTANYILMGDLNLYKSSELAYQHLTAPQDTLARLNDPLNRPGNWDENIAFAATHTQSPRTVAGGDGGATGGMDSRFDFILVSDAVMQGTKGIRYLPGSYTVVGNDGLHYDKAVNELPNNSVPQSLLEPLLRCADHLPVYADFIISPDTLLHPARVRTGRRVFERVRFANPIGSSIRYSAELAGAGFDYALFTPDGRLLRRGRIEDGTGVIDVEEFQPGLFLLRLTDGAGSQDFRKLLKQE